jgi:hypothetical protein
VSHAATNAEARVLVRRIRVLVAVFIVGLVLSGATAMPIVNEVAWLTDFCGARALVETPTSTNPPDWAVWLCRIDDALREIDSKHPFVAYGFDWLAFGHFMLALAFVWVWREPVRNRWLFDFGLIACALVIPFALIAGHFRGIPVWWRVIDISFGVVGAVPLWLARRDAEMCVELERTA